MKKDKVGYILLFFTIIMLGLFGYVIYTKIGPNSSKYIKETELEEIDLEDKLVKRGLSVIDFNYRHDLTSVEDKLFNSDKVQVNDLNSEEKMILTINDVGYNHTLPATCSSDQYILSAKGLENTIIRDKGFLKDYKSKRKYDVGPYTIIYNGTLAITNNYCSTPSEYPKIVPISAKKSNKRLIIQLKYIYIEEVTNEENTIFVSYKDNKKENLVEENYTETSPNDEYYTYEVTYNIIDENLYFNNIIKVK